ncbi:hypothetical protein EBT31_10940 [bacterium]|jgi:hypothetical protein|nr:hypothetical protein [bacterium]
MKPTTSEKTAMPTMKVWEVSFGELPRAFIKAYGKEQAKNEYRLRYQLHESRQPIAVEFKDVSGN